MAQYAKTFDALLTSQKAGGVTLASGKAYFYEPGTLTLKTIYTSREKTSAAANPYTLSADGTAQIYGDGLYDVKITNSALVEKAFWEDVEIKSVDYLGYNVRDYATFNAAVAAIGSTPATLVVDSATTCTADTTVPSTLSIVINKPGLITISIGKTLTTNIIAGAYQIVAGAGSLVVLNADGIKPEWFADISNPALTATAAIQKAITCAMASYAHIELSDRQYYLATAVTIDRPIATYYPHPLQFKGSANSKFYIDSSMSMFTSSIGTTAPLSMGVEFVGITFEADESVVHNAYVMDGDKFLEVKFINCNFWRIRAAKATHYFQTWHFLGGTARGWGGTFFEGADGAYDINISDMIVESGASFIKLRTDDSTTRNIVGLRLNGNLIQGLTGYVLTGNQFFGLGISGNYFELNGSGLADTVSPIDLGKATTPADHPNRGVNIKGNSFDSGATRAASSDFYEVNLGLTTGFDTGGNASSCRLYNNPLTPIIDHRNDDTTLYANVPTALNPSYGTFTATVSGFTTTVQVTASYEVHGNIVTLRIPIATGTSNSATTVLSGLPSHIFPATGTIFVAQGSNNSTSALLTLYTDTDGTLVIADSAGNNLSNTGTKALYSSVLTYPVR